MKKGLVALALLIMAVCLYGMRPAEKERHFNRWRELARLIDQGKATGDDILELSGLVFVLLEDLAENSKSRWFFTNNLIYEALAFKGTPIKETPPYGLTIVVPDALKNQLENPLIFLVSFQQIESTCGFQALANAYALSEQVNKDEQITFDRTRNLAEKVFQNKIEPDPDFKKLVCPLFFSKPEYSDLLSVIKKLGFRSHFEGNANFFLVDTKNIGEQQGIKMQSKQIALNKITHFMYRTSDHFLLVSVIKKNNTYTMIALDSANSPVAADGERARIIKYVDNLIQRVKKSSPDEPISSSTVSRKEREERRQKELEQERQRGAEREVRKRERQRQLELERRRQEAAARKRKKEKPEKPSEKKSAITLKRESLLNRLDKL